MEENSRKCGGDTRKAKADDGSRNVSGGGGGGKQRRPENDGEAAGDHVFKCSGRNCRSCTGGAIADCVAVCCCPCAVVNILALAFVKVPYAVGRRCLGKCKKKKGRLRNGEGMGLEIVKEGNGMERVKMEIDIEKESNNSSGGRGGGGGGNNSARNEAEKVWLELYEDGHLGFGRVSFSGIESPLGIKTN